MDDMGGAKRKKRKPKIAIQNNNDCVTCSSCHSKLVKVSDITKISLDELKVAGKGNVLTCSACGSELRLLSGFVS
ncbi:111L [Yaba monkey tumor virus]|uniref:111L n=1 Tax=Yaba monkey tumor virus (strain VR587) TaxID=928314 RepID=Q6TUQ8_YMTV5|nr:111L [Yaba monkey tumor virus]AAR07467.1 111L [Yaba monkey tumor virus]